MTEAELEGYRQAIGAVDAWLQTWVRCELRQVLAFLDGAESARNIATYHAGEKYHRDGVALRDEAYEAEVIPEAEPEGYSETMHYRCDKHPTRWIYAVWEGEDEASSEPTIVRGCGSCAEEHAAAAERELRELGEIP